MFQRPESFFGFANCDFEIMQVWSSSWGLFKVPFFWRGGAVAVVWQKKLSLIRLSCDASNWTAELKRSFTSAAERESPSLCNVLVLRDRIH